MSQGNILGEPFENFVKGQIEIRQKKLGKSDSYYSTKTPWIRLASSVNIEKFVDPAIGVVAPGVANITKANRDLAALGYGFNTYGSDNLAKNFILFGGSANYSGSLFDGFGNNLSSAYGWGGINQEDLGDRGYIPMPGIESVNVSYQNNGALAKINIKIKCYTRRQLALIDYLYLRPGYTLLLEFGWSRYYDNSGNLITFNDWSTKPFEDLFASGKTQYDLYSSIQNEKEKYEGNYEAFLGKITNFKWSLNRDGSYSCETILTTLGDVIESLKLNTSSNSTTPTEVNDEIPPVEAYQNLSNLHKILYNLHQKAKEKGNSTIQDLPQNVNYISGSNIIEETINFKNGLWSLTGVTIEEEYLDTVVNQTYIKFGILCAILQTNFILYNNKTPITGFDIKYKDLDNDYNYMLTFPGHISGDPSICLIPITDPIDFPELNNYSFIKKKNALTPKYDQFSFCVDSINGVASEDDPFKGRISNIFVNINYLSKLATNIPKDEDNNILILDYLKEVLNGISSALGGINNFSIEPNINNGLVRIYDKSPQIVLQKRQPVDYAKFNIFGVKPGVEGNFVREINMSSELSSNFASMVSIGAQSQGNQIPGNATSFSEFNQGLIDRLIPTKTTPPQTVVFPFTNIPIQSSTSQQSSTSLEFNDSYEKVYFEKMFLPEYLESLKTTLTEYNKLFLGYYFQNPPPGVKVRTPFFIPFNLSLTLDGLAGMVLYQKFLIDENVLPLSYGENNVDFIIKGIDHTVNVNSWTTKIETVSSPIPK